MNATTEFRRARFNEATAETWIEISEQDAYYCLGVLPPINFPGGFAVSEPIRDDEHGRPLYTAIVTIARGGACRYFARQLAAPDMARESNALRDSMA